MVFEATALWTQFSYESLDTVNEISTFLEQT